jgi:hypothetical protein
MPGHCFELCTCSSFYLQDWPEPFMYGADIVSWKENYSHARFIYIPGLFSSGFGQKFRFANFHAF